MRPSSNLVLVSLLCLLGGAAFGSLATTLAGRQSTLAIVKNTDTAPPPQPDEGSSEGDVATVYDVPPDDPSWTDFQHEEPFNLPLLSLQKKATSDLDGDGKPDRIELTSPSDSGFTVTINGVATVIPDPPTENPERPDGFALVTIDQEDHAKTIVVHQAAGPDLNVTFLTLLHFDGKTVQKIAVLQDEANFPGDGTAVLDHYRGFWNERYEVRIGTHGVETVPQPLYYVGLRGRVDEAFSLLGTKKGTNVIAHLSVGENIRIIASDAAVDHCPGMSGDIYTCQEKEWYLILSSRGILGWAELKTFHGKVEGLVWAG
jgi:hypothetical protein